MELAWQRDSVQDGKVPRWAPIVLLAAAVAGFEGLAETCDRLLLSTDEGPKNELRWRPCWGCLELASRVLAAPIWTERLTLPV